MKRFKDLVRDWQEKAKQAPKVHDVTIKLSTHDYARLLALAEIYKEQGGEEVWGDLVSTALDEIEEAFPYVEGDKVVGEDELGDPLFEDAGLTPRFEALTRQFSTAENENSKS